MLRNLFAGLTGRPKRGEALFERAVGEARRPSWYRDGEVPDTIDGRFAVLATVTALLIVRLESGPPAADAASAALTERFIEAMDAEHRELGLNDPGLGRRVRKLVGALGRRVDLWRATTSGESSWNEAVLSSLYRDPGPRDSALEFSCVALRELWRRLQGAADPELAGGDF